MYQNHFRFFTDLYTTKGSPPGVVANVQDCDIMVYELKLHSSYHLYFQTK